MKNRFESSMNSCIIAAAPEMLDDWIKAALRIEEYYKCPKAPKNQCLDLIYVDAVKNVEKATGKSWTEIKEIMEGE